MKSYPILIPNGFIARPMPDHASAQCCVLESDEFKLLRSYQTIVLVYHKTTNVLWCTGTYSMTTARHINWFCRYELDGCVNYHDCKYIYAEYMGMNIHGCGTFPFTTDSQLDYELHECSKGAFSAHNFKLAMKEGGVL